MALLKGAHKSIVAENIRSLRRAGKSEAQAVVLAMSKANGKKAAVKAGKPKPAADDHDFEE